MFGKENLFPTRFSVCEKTPEVLWSLSAHRVTSLGHLLMWACFFFFLFECFSKSLDLDFLSSTSQPQSFSFIPSTTFRSPSR